VKFGCEKGAELRKSHFSSNFNQTFRLGELYFEYANKLLCVVILSHWCLN